MRIEGILGMLQPLRNSVNHWSGLLWKKLKRLRRQEDKFWLVTWVLGIGLLGIWNLLFLNRPALIKVQTGALNTLVIALLVIVISLALGWSVALGLNFLERNEKHTLFNVANFLLNLLRSIPQIVGILLGYVLMTHLVQLRSPGGAVIIVGMAVIISIFVFLEIVDLIRERIQYYRKSDFYNAMLVCGIRESRIVNLEILWKNSLAHIFNKLISIFGITIFLQCSIDFIISVGLSTDVAISNFPVTLGSLLAKIDSKQDILAIGNTLTDPGYFPRLFFTHLQGLTVAFLIVFTLICVYQISNGFARRFKL